MNRSSCRNTAILAVGPTGILPVGWTNSPGKSQTLSGKSRQFAWSAPRKLQTVSLQFKSADLGNTGQKATKITKLLDVIFRIWESVTPKSRGLLVADQRAAKKVGMLSQQ